MGHLHYHAVYDHIKRHADNAGKHLHARNEPASPEVSKLRPQSGRATVIRELMGEGLIPAMPMKYARNAPSSHKAHLKYGQLSLADV